MHKIRLYSTIHILGVYTWAANIHMQNPVQDELEISGLIVLTIIHHPCEYLSSNYSHAWLLLALLVQVVVHACISLCQGSKPNRSSSPALPKEPNGEPVMNPRLLGDDGKLPGPHAMSLVPPGQYSAGADPTVADEVMVPADPTTTAASCAAGGELLLSASSLPQR